MPVKSLSKEAEQRILRAAGDTVDLVLAGMDPTDAVVKVAMEIGLPQGHSRLVARAYNVAKTNQQREQGNSILEKTAEFPLADGDAAEERLFPSATTVKKAECLDVSIDYLLPPTYLNKKTAKSVLSKSASEFLGVEEVKPAAKPAYYNTRNAEAREQAARLRYEDARMESSASFDKLAAAFDDLQVFFKRADPVVYADTVEHNNLLGNSSSLLALALIRPWLSCNHKQASCSNAIHSQRQTQYLLLEQVKQASIDWADRLRRLEERRGDLQEHLPKREAKKIVSDSILDGDVLDTKSANFLTGMLSSTAGNAAGGAALDAAKNSPMLNNEAALNKAVDSLQDPNHEAMLKNIRTQAMLHSLMLHDPVIKGHNPNDVLSAFSELSETAPQLADQVLIMQPLLRKRLSQGVLDPFEVSQIMSMNRVAKTASEPTTSNSIL